MIAEASERPPQGIVLRYMCTGHAGLDFVSADEFNRLPRIDPTCLGESVFLALPIRDTPNGPPVRWRIRQFNASSAAEVLTWRSKKPDWQDVRIATDAEVREYRDEEALRSKAARAQRIRAEVAELERFARNAHYCEEVLQALRAIAVTPER